MIKFEKWFYVRVIKLNICFEYNISAIDKTIFDLKLTEISNKTTQEFTLCSKWLLQ